MSPKLFRCPQCHTVFAPNPVHMVEVCRYCDTQPRLELLAPEAAGAEPPQSSGMMHGFTPRVECRVCGLPENCHSVSAAPLPDPTLAAKVAAVRARPFGVFVPDDADRARWRGYIESVNNLLAYLDGSRE